MGELVFLPFLLLPIFLFTENASVFCGSFGVSASRYSSTKNVRVITVVVPELKFCNVQRHVLAADFVERADNTALHQRPETLNRVGVNRTDNIFLVLVLDVGVGKFAAEFPISHQVVGDQQTDFVGNRFADEAGKRLTVEAINNASDNCAFAFDVPLRLTAPMTPILPEPVPPVPPLRLFQCLFLSFPPM